MTGRQSFIGSPATVAAAINDLVQADASDGFILVPHITPGGLDEFADTVVPLLQERGVFRTEYEGSTLRDHLGLAPAGPARRPPRPGGVMRFLAITLIVHAPDPVTGVQKSTTERFREVIDSALLAEELGFDGFGVGERHERPFISSSPPVVLSHIAALTSRIRLFTAVTTLSLLDPVRAYEDYATLDHLSGGRLELIIGKGNGAAQRELFQRHPRRPVGPQRRELRAVPADLAQPEGDRDAAVPAAAAPRPRSGRGRCSSRSGSGTAAPPARSRSTSPPATATRCSRPTSPTRSSPTPSWCATTASAGRTTATTRPRRWSARARPATTRPAARRRRWASTGRSSTRTLRSSASSGCQPVFTDLEDFVERSSALIGSPQQVIDKVHRYHEQFGHSVLHLHAEAGGLTEAQHRDSLELFQSEIAPVLRRDIPDPPWPWRPPPWTAAPACSQPPGHRTG